MLYHRNALILNDALSSFYIYTCDAHAGTSLWDSYLITFLYYSSYSGLYGLPKRNGKLKDISHFDAAFFGVHPKQAHTMDPQLRLLLEVAYEAILDGGENVLVGWGEKF